MNKSHSVGRARVEHENSLAIECHFDAIISCVPSFVNKYKFVQQNDMENRILIKNHYYHRRYNDENHKQGVHLYTVH